MSSQQKDMSQHQPKKERRQSFDLIDTGKHGSKEGPDYAIDLQDHTGVVDDKTHLKDDIYTTNYYNRYAAKDASTGAGFEPAVSQRIATEPDKENEGGASTRHLSSSADVSDQDSSVFELRGAPSQAESAEETAARIRAGLREHIKNDPNVAPLMFNRDGSRHESLNMKLQADNAQCFKEPGYFGAGICGHAADEQAFAHPLSATGRRRESVMLNEMEEQNVHRRYSTSSGPFELDDKLTEEPSSLD
ncbi:hypothetical protein BDF19DRAFT_455804 [Syncephalis fuscata]|nr:hypothetical protein BDF19DRAFT_455804 [Syncephalis fuscata]